MWPLLQKTAQKCNKIDIRINAKNYNFPYNFKKPEKAQILKKI